MPLSLFQKTETRRHPFSYECQGGDLMPLRLDTRSPDFGAAFNALLAMKREVAEDVDQTVCAIIAEVIARGDAALIGYTRKFDSVDLEKLGLRVDDGEI